MQLESGRYFGETRATSLIGDAGLTITDYVAQEQPWHTHENPTFFVNLRGHHRDALPNGSFDQPVLSIVYHPAGVRHRSTVGPEGMTGLNIELPPLWLAAHEIERANLGPERLVRNHDASCVAIKLLDAMVACNLLDTDNALVDFAASVSNDPGYCESPAWMHKAIELTENLAAESLTIRQISEQVGVHPVHLARVFRKAYGMSFCSYLQRGRLRYATSLLLQGMSAGEAAIEAGFGDQFYMSRCFRRQFGFTPRRVNELRRQVVA
jgi:AraC family transcriptional regulator